MVSFTLNDKRVSVDADANTPLLWVIRDHVGLTGTKYGCGAGVCGACTVHLKGKAGRACQTQVSEVTDKKVVAELLAANPKPNREQIVTHMDGNICRCGTYHRIIAAVEQASREG